ncbi:AAA family ATPase, partial [Aetokthonos hydrillicola]|uniref:AAA family ATPase n=1 Tax=Aetokthonos hydrillicola TaxID=1550245 RepID=UPI001ABA8FE4
LSIDLAYAVATGGLFLGEQVKQGKVLIINSDQPLNVTASYLSDRGFDEDTPNWKVIGQTGNMAAWTIKDLDLLETWLSETKPDLVIIDSIRTTICYPLGLEEKSELVGHWLKEVERLVIRYGSLLWVHHDNKDTNLAGVSRSSGSTAIPGNVSVHWRLEKASKDDSDPNRIFSMPKTRLFEPSTLTVRFDNTNGQWLNLGRVGESPDVAKQNQSLQQRVLDLLQQRPSVGFEVQEIREKVGGGDSLYTVLSRMVQRGIISKRRGKTSKSKVYFWENNFSPNTQQETVENLEKVAQPPLSQFSQLSVRNETEKLTAHESCSPNSHLTLTQKSPNSCESTGHVLGDENSCPVSDTAINQSHLTPHLTGGEGFVLLSLHLTRTPPPHKALRKGMKYM